MKINLTQVTLKPTIAGPEVTKNLTREVAEAIYQDAKTLAATSFALRLFNAEGEIEISEEEKGFIETAIRMFKYWVQAPILDMLK